MGFLSGPQRMAGLQWPCYTGFHFKKKNILLAKWFGNEGFGAFGSQSPAFRFTSLHFVFALIGFRNKGLCRENRPPIINPTAVPILHRNSKWWGYRPPKEYSAHFQNIKMRLNCRNLAVYSSKFSNPNNLTITKNS